MRSLYQLCRVVLTLLVTAGISLARPASALAVANPLAESPPEQPPANGIDKPAANETELPIAFDPQPYLHSGEFHLSATDLQIAGRELDFVWARKYRSRIGPNTAMGNGWDFSYNIYIEPSGPDILLHDGNTREDLYLFNPLTGAWEADEFFREFTLDPNPPPFGAYTLTFADTGVWRFLPLDGSPQQGRLSEISDRNGNTLVFVYDPGTGRLIAIHDTLDNPPANPRVITIAYNPFGFIESVTDFTGRSVAYAYYDGIEPGGNFGDLKSVTTPVAVGTPNGNDFPAGKTTIYTYSTGFGDPALNSNLLTITDPKGQTYLTNEYAPTINPVDLEFDHVVRQTWGDPTDIIDIVYTSLVPDPFNNFAVVKATVNDRVGNVSEHFFDAANRMVIDRDYVGRADPALPTDLDAAINPPINPLRLGDPACPNQPAQPFYETRFEWNIDALPTLITHPNGNVTQNVYEPDVNSMPARRSRGNLRERHRLPGTHTPAGDQVQIVEFFEYQGGFGACCGMNFVTRHVDGRGNETLHTYDPNGNRLHTTHRIPSIVEDFTYNAFGQMATHTWPDNGSLSRRVDTFTYYDPADGCMNGYPKEKIIDTPGFGLTTTYEYDCLGRLTRTIDPRGADTQYTLNALDQVVREMSREVALGGGIRYERLFWYDANDNVIRVDIENKDDLGVLQPNTHFSTIYEYDILNYLVRECREVGSANLLPADLTCAALPAAESITTEYAYDANRNRSLVRYGEAVNGNQPANTAQTLFDERDLVFQVIRAPGDADQSTAQYDYDCNGNLIAVRQGLEGPTSVPPSVVRVTMHAYDGYDRLVQIADPMGNVTDYHYDANGNVGGDQAPAVPNPFGLRIGGELNDVPGGAGNLPLSVTQYEYDPMDRIIRTVVDFFDTDTQLPINVPPTPDGKSITEVQWTDNSQVRLVIDDNLHQTTTVYDTANRALTVTDAKGNTATRAYDANSNVISIAEVEKSDLLNPDQLFTTTYAYDNLDRLIRIIDNVGNTHESAHDSRNNRTRMTDTLGNETRYVYDGVNRLIRTVRDMDGLGANMAAVPGDGDPDIVTVKVWDDTSRLFEDTEDNDNVTRYIYDALDRRIVEQYADCTQHVSTYDVHHNRLTRTDPNGSVITCTYDLLNRLSTRSIAPGLGVSDDTTLETYLYDGLSRLIGVEDDDSRVTRSYDSLSRVTRETLNVVPPFNAADDRTTTSLYDGVGNQLTCTYPGGRVITCTYDELDRKKTVSDGAGTIATYDYIGPSRVERREYGNGTRTDDLYDGITGSPNPPGDLGVKQIIGTTHSRIADGTIIDDRSYLWDAMYNKKQRKDVRVAGPQLTHTYVYDSIYRLTRAIVTDPVPATVRDTLYDLDGVGNRNTVTGTGVTGPYALDPALCEPGDFQMNQYTGTAFDNRRYDANGDLIDAAPCIVGDTNGDLAVDLGDLPSFVAGLLAGGPVSCETDVSRDGRLDGRDIEPMITVLQGGDPPALYVYDYRNRMVEHNDPLAGLVTTYAYDSLDRRIVRVVDTDGVPDETRYYYDDWQVVEEQNAAGTTEATYVYGLYIDEVLTMQRGGGEFFYHTDDLYNVMVVTDAAAAVAERYGYDDYGAPEILLARQAGDLSAAVASDDDLFPGPNVVQILADDFTFAQPTRITGLRWWGGYSTDPMVPATDEFTIDILADDGLGGAPGTLLHREAAGDVGRADTGRTIAFPPPNGLTEFVYQYRLDQPFDADAGVTYWLEVKGNTTGHASTWGWELSADGNGVLAFTVDGSPWALDVGDLAFELITDQSSIGNPHLFTGRRYDPESGWYYYRTRYLDPVAGRFTTRDTIGIWGDPINLGNGYAYVGNNTFSSGRVDPSGMMAYANPLPPPPPVDFGPTPEQEWEEFDRAWELYVRLLDEWELRRELWFIRGATPGSSSHTLDYPERPRPPDWRPSSPRPSPPLILPSEERSSLDPFGRQTIMGITFTTPMQSMGWWGPGGSIIFVTWWGTGPARPGFTGFQWGTVPAAMIPTILSPPGFPTGFLPIPQWPGGGIPAPGPKQRAGLCVDGSCRLVTPDGPRPLAEVHIGDEVLTPGGEFRRVVDKDFGSVWNRRRNDYVRITTPSGSIVLTRDHIIGGRPAGQWRDGDWMALRSGEVSRVAVRSASSEVSGDLRLEGDADYVTADGFVVGSMMSRSAVSNGAS